MGKISHSPYPIIDGHRKHYVLHPVPEGNKWVAVEVINDGYISPSKNPAKVRFDTEDECQKACDIHNKFHKFTPEIVEQIISESMA